VQPGAANLRLHQARQARVGADKMLQF
jgi:hypothetical protein